jgi:hypothetical protein
LYTQAGTTYLLKAVKRTLDRNSGTKLADMAIKDDPWKIPELSKSASSSQQSDANEADPAANSMFDWRLSSQPQHSPAVTAQGSHHTPPSKVTHATLTDPAELQNQHPHPVVKVAQSFDGLDAYDSLFGSNSNGQMVRVPASPSLAVGRGFVLEVVNTVLRVYDEATGATLTPIVDTHTFFGLPPAFDTVTRKFGPILADTRALYDTHTDRWFIVANSQERDTVREPSLAGPRSGVTFLEIAVSDSHNPTGNYARGWHRLVSLCQGQVGGVVV